ncbi:zinc-ribbon domain-containing protein [Gymnodinialimonas sp. 2305UL16-5]|uniref:zinc-ribbon domain-containing protein n=1 Tax=Gymnodinialimonas mytili TaxID=3126503 RepID=UPI00309CA1C2
MRLTCPKCSARYEVDQSMIPATGRDVQCSNCATTWFQPGIRSPEAAMPSPPPMDTASRDDDTSETTAQTGPATTPDPAPETPVNPEPAIAEPQRREMDPSVADILREEAEREALLRRGAPEPEPVETQSEMSLDNARPPRGGASIPDVPADAETSDAPTPPPSVAATVAAATAAAEAEAEAGRSRSELLPDIEEINSTLRATGDRALGGEDATDIDALDAASKRRRHVRRGFFLVLLLALAAWGVYTQAPAIAEAVPQATPYLLQYVEQVDSARIWLDAFARQIVTGES